MAPPPAAGTETGGVHTVAGNGADIWNAADEFRFVYQQLTGDGTITARVTAFTGTGTINANAKAGVMIRQNLTAGSPHLLSCLPPQRQATLIKQIRRAHPWRDLASHDRHRPGLPPLGAGDPVGHHAHHLRVDQRHQLDPGGHRPDHRHAGRDTVYVGLAVTSHVDGTNYTATFDNVTVTTPAPPTAPTGLSAMGGVNQATLTWTDTSNNETGFKIERKLTADPDTSFAQIGTAAVNATSFTNTTVPAGNYTYRVRASGSPTDSAYSNTANATVSNPPPPSAPSGPHRQRRREPGGPRPGPTPRATRPASRSSASRPAIPTPATSQVGTTGANVTTLHQQLGARGRLHLPGEGHQRLR